VTTAQAHTESLSSNLPASAPGDSTTTAAPDSVGTAGNNSHGRAANADSAAGIDYLAFADFSDIDALATAAPVFRTATAKEVFGPSSIAVVPVPTLHEEASMPLSGNAVFQGGVLLLAAAYAILLYRHSTDAKLLLARIFRDRASGERLSEEPGSNGFARFLKISGFIGLGFIGLGATKFADTLLAPDALPPLRSAGSASLVFALLWVAVAAFQSLLLHIAGILTLARPVIAQLQLIKRTYSAFAVVAAVPSFLLFALAPPGTAAVWFYATVAGLAVTALLYLRESRHLFLAKKIPILHWFLYLCVVEIFPFSFLWLIAAR